MVSAFSAFSAFSKYYVLRESEKSPTGELPQQGDLIVVLWLPHWGTSPSVKSLSIYDACFVENLENRKTNQASNCWQTAYCVVLIYLRVFQENADFLGCWQFRPKIQLNKFIIWVRVWKGA